MEKMIKAKSNLVEKWRPKVVMSVEHLEILHDIIPKHTFNYKEWDDIYSAYEAKFPYT